MRASKIITGVLAWMIITMLVIPAGISAQDSGQPEQTDRFTEEELVQMLAPIALYPDSLIAQILMASTYPLEVVEAERWLNQNKKLQGDKLDDALMEKPWDPSIKSLCQFPDVLFALSDKLDQTRKLGDAFLNQQDDVMNTIQKLRHKAQEQGNLKTTEEQEVIVEKEIISIEPTDPYVVYVPAYDPFYVYGPWWYPSYPPWYWYYPSGVVISSGFVTFGPPFFIGFDLFLWRWFDWPGHHIYVDYYYGPHSFRRHHRGDPYPDRRRHRDDRDSGKQYWKHDPSHRKGVAYRDRTTSRRFDPAKSRVPKTGTEMRGYPGRDSERRNHRSVIEQQRSPVTPRGGVERERRMTAPERDNTFRGIGDGNFERRASERGDISRKSREATRQSEGIRRDRGASPQSREKVSQGGRNGKGGGFRDSGKDRAPRR